jgi:segregation and condensation protein A
MTEQIVNQKLPSATEQQQHYVVHLTTFEGPLDLLLHLIEKRQLEITAISLLAVTDQYLDYLQHWQEQQLPLANMAEFISIAARLLYIKSQSLLPHNPDPEQNTDNTTANVLVEELQQHLLEYKLAKEIAQVLRIHEEQGRQTHARSGLLAGIEAQLAWTPPTLVDLDAQKLAQTFQRLLELQAREKDDGSSLLPTERVRVSERIEEIMGRLGEQPSITLEAILSGEHSRFVIVVTFMAVLELWKWDRIQITQETLLGPIVIERGERWNEAEPGQYDLDE